MLVGSHTLHPPIALETEACAIAVYRRPFGTLSEPMLSSRDQVNQYCVHRWFGKLSNRLGSHPPRLLFAVRYRLRLY